MKELSLEEAIITIFMECDFEDSHFHNRDFYSDEIVSLFGITRGTVQIYYLVSKEVSSALYSISEEYEESKDFMKKLLDTLKSSLGIEGSNLSESEVIGRMVKKLGGVYPISKEYYLKNKEVYGSTFYDDVVAWNEKYLK